MDRRCIAAVPFLDEYAFHQLFKEEQAKVDAIRALIDASWSAIQLLANSHESLPN
jgi:hypothetical protein